MYTLAIDDVVEVPVKFTLKAGKVNKPFSVTLIARRQTKEEAEAASDVTIKDFLLDNVTDWTDQRLVLGDNGEPAAFSRAAFEYMLSATGVLTVCWHAYLKECGAKEKN